MLNECRRDATGGGGATPPKGHKSAFHSAEWKKNYSLLGKLGGRHNLTSYVNVTIVYV